MPPKLSKRQVFKLQFGHNRRRGGINHRCKQRGMNNESINYRVNQYRANQYREPVVEEPVVEEPGPVAKEEVVEEPVVEEPGLVVAVKQELVEEPMDEEPGLVVEEPPVVIFIDHRQNLIEQHRHIQAIGNLNINPLFKHWGIIQTTTRMPASYHPDKEIRGECMAYAHRAAREHMAEEKNASWTTRAIEVAHNAAKKFKQDMVPILYPDWRDGAHAY
eukprot:9496709-Pyramimonas_sp.AAC.2